jgi:hypothetical protein
MRRYPQVEGLASLTSEMISIEQSDQHMVSKSSLPHVLLSLAVKFSG